MSKNYIFTSESVSAGHPDKVCDQISDGLVDAYLKIDPEARLAIETLATTNQVILAGETRIAGKLENSEVEQIIRNIVKDIGYVSEDSGFCYKNLQITNLLHAQSPDIAQGVDASSDKEEGAGDQGIMFGYACDETEDFMPAPIYYINKILRNIDEAIKNEEIQGLGPDAKGQITLKYENGRPVGVQTLLISIQHREEISESQIRELIRPYILKTLPKDWMCAEENFLVNPTGKFVIGGPDGDCGLTGRKIIVDTYGGSARHGGGAFSGKDPTKVDRSAAYITRHIAKNIVAAGLANKCTIQLSYAIGLAQPLSFYINTYNTNKISEEQIAQKAQSLLDLSPSGIRKYLNLNRPIYQKTASYGHFGRKAHEDGHFSWEKLNLVDELRLPIAG